MEKIILYAELLFVIKDKKDGFNIKLPERIRPHEHWLWLDSNNNVIEGHNDYNAISDEDYPLRVYRPVSTSSSKKQDLETNPVIKLKSQTENGDTFVSIDNTRVSKMLNNLENESICDKSEKAMELFPQWFEPTSIHEYRKYKKRFEEEMAKIVLSGSPSSIQDIQYLLHEKMIEESKEPFQMLKDAERKKIVFSHFWVKGFGWQNTCYIQDDFDIIKVKYEYSNGESMFLAYDGKELVILKGYYVKD
jgi:hypothetical protein